MLQVTVVGVDGRLVYESLVCPENSIIDFNTRYSGISAKDFGKLTIIRIINWQVIHCSSWFRITIGFIFLSLVIGLLIIDCHKYNDNSNQNLETIVLDYLYFMILSVEN